METTRAKFCRTMEPARRIVSTQSGRGRAGEKVQVAIIIPKLVYAINRDTQDVNGVPVNTPHHDVDNLSCINVSVDGKGLIRRRSHTRATYVTTSLQTLGYRVVYSSSLSPSQNSTGVSYKNNLRVCWMYVRSTY